MTSQFSQQAHELGQPLGQWKVRSSYLSKYYIRGGILAIFGLGLMLCGLLGLFAEEGGVELLACCGSVGLIVGGLGLTIGVETLKERDLEVQVFTEGLIYTKRGEHTLARWDDITAVWQEKTDYKRYGMTTYTVRKFTIQLRDGHEFHLDNTLDEIETLGQTIQNQITQRQLPQAIQSLKEGATVSFGKKLAVSTQGLSNGKETIPWNQVQSVRINQGIITIQKQGKWFDWSSIRVANTPNVFVFVALIEAIMSGNETEALGLGNGI